MKIILQFKAYTSRNPEYTTAQKLLGQLLCSKRFAASYFDMQPFNQYIVLGIPYSDGQKYKKSTVSYTKMRKYYSVCSDIYTT